MQVHCPVHESLTAPDGEDDAINMVDGHGLDDHSFGPKAPISGDESITFRAGGGGVSTCTILSCETEERVGREIELKRGEVWWEPGVGIERRFGKVIGSRQT